jgi:putative MATE family efflux protein
MERTNHKLMTDGIIWKEILLFSIPLLLGNLFQQLYNTVDSIVVGNYIGSHALAAVGASNPIINLLVGFFMGISTGAGVLISRYFGAKNQEDLTKSVQTSIIVTTLSGIVLTFIGILFTPLILKWVGTPEDVMADSILYLQIYFAGILSVMLYNMGSGILRAVGDSKRPLYFLCISSIINIVLDLYFVISLHMGITGVALATLIAQSVSAVLVLYILIRTKESYRFSLKNLHLDMPILKNIIRLGLPSGIQNAIVSFSNVIVQSNINAFGSDAMAGCGSYVKLDGFAIMPIMSFSMAITTFTGQNMGAEKYDRVKEGAKSCLWLSLGVITSISLLLFLFGDHVLKIFSQDEQVLYYGVYMLKVLVPGYIFLSITQILAGVIRGAGVAAVPMYIMVGCWCIFRIIWIVGAMSIYPDIIVVFLGYTLSWILSSIIIFRYYQKGSWLKGNTM